MTEFQRGEWVTCIDDGQNSAGGRLPLAKYRVAWLYDSTSPCRFCNGVTHPCLVLRDEGGAMILSEDKKPGRWCPTRFRAVVKGAEKLVEKVKEPIPGLVE